MNKKIEVTIKKVTSNEPNVSARHLTYDVYHNGKYHKTFNDVNDALDHKEKMQNEQVELDETLSIEQRRKRAQVMRAHHTKIERAREISQRKLAAEKNIRKRSFQLARSIMRKKLAGERGAEYAKLGPSEKISIDRMLDGKANAIKKLALRLMPKVKKAEYERLQSYLHGHSIQNMGAEEGHTMKENVNDLFEAAFTFPQDPNKPNLAGSPNSTTASGLGKPRLPKTSSQQGKTSKPAASNIKMHKSFSGDKVSEAIDRKANQSGIEFDVLAEVFSRGLDAWTEDCKVNQVQYAFARVNSYINQGKTYFNEDADLHEMGGDQHYGDSKDATSGGAKGTPISKKKMDKDASETLNQMFQKSVMKKEDVDLQEATESIHELLPATYDSYAKKSNKEAIGLVKKIGDINNKKYANRTNAQPLNKLGSEDEDQKSRLLAKLKQRKLGQATAVNKLNQMKTEEIEIVEACWEKYKQVGTKLKNGRRVPNCVPEQVQPEVQHKNTKKRKDIENVDRNINDRTELGKQTEIIRKIIEQSGNKVNDPKKRLQGTDSLDKAYRADTPGQSVNESFNIAFAAGIGVSLTSADLGMKMQGGFALHPSVIDQIEENAVTADREPVIVAAHKDAYGNTIPAKAEFRKTRRNILKTEDTHDGEPS